MTRPEHLGGERYRVRISVGIDRTTGKHRQVSRSFKAPNQRAANRQAATIEAKLRADQERAVERRGTVNGLVDEWLVLHATHAETTQYRNRSIVAAIRDGLGHRKLTELTVRDVDLWYARLLTEGRSSSTVHHYHRVLHGILVTGESWDYMPVAVTRKVRPPARSRPKPRPPETTTLVAVLEDATPGLQVAATIAAKLGLRRGEILGLRWTDLVGDQLTVARSATDVPGKGTKVKLPKTSDSARTISVDGGTLAVLEVWRDGCRRRFAELAPDAYVIPDPLDPTGRTPRRPGWLSLVWRRHTAKHGVHIRFHDLRHWSATNMIGAGVPITTVAARLGHARTSTTVDVYARALRGSDTDAATALGELLPVTTGTPRPSAHWSDEWPSQPRHHAKKRSGQRGAWSVEAVCRCPSCKARRDRIVTPVSEGDRALRARRVLVALFPSANFVNDEITGAPRVRAFRGEGVAQVGQAHPLAHI